MRRRRGATHDGPAVTTDQGAEELRRPLCNNENIRILALTGALGESSLPSSLILHMSSSLDLSALINALLTCEGSVVVEVVVYSWQLARADIMA